MSSCGCGLSPAIVQGQWSEFHQNKAKLYANDFGMRMYHLDMYDYHHREYLRLTKEEQG